MNIIDNGVEQGMESRSPLFASSWMALYLLLKQEFESLRDDEPREQKKDGQRLPDRTN